MMTQECDDKCNVNLWRTDTYDIGIPDADVETCLKVLRTIRDVYLKAGPKSRLMVATPLTHAHCLIVDLVENVQTMQASP